MSIQGISSTMSHIKSVHRITYVVNKTTSEVTLYVNKSQYAGRYATIADAQLAAQGLLTKCGCSRPAERILNVPQEIQGTGTTTVSPAINFVNINVDPSISTWTGAQQRIQGITMPVVLRFSATPSDTSLYVKTSSSTMLANSGTKPSLDGYTRVNAFPMYLIVSPSDFVRIKTDTENYAAVLPGPITTVTVSNMNSNSLVLDTFEMQYQYSAP